MKAAAFLVVVMLLAGCGAREVTPPTEDPAASSAPSPSAPLPTGSGATPVASTAAPATPASTTSPTAAAPTDDRFWAGVLAGLDEAGRLTLVLASDGSPVELYYLPDASGARVGGAFVSLCDGERAYAGDAAGLVEVPGSWRCGFGALIDGLRASGRPNDAWSADFPPETFGTVAVAREPDGTWAWTFEQALGPEGPATTRLVLDPTSGRLLGGRVVDGSGTVTIRVDYVADLPTFPAP